LQFSFLLFNFINHDVSCLQYPKFSSMVECAFAVGFTPSSNRVLFLLDWLLRS
jgi:hypothetical protein